MTEPDGPNPNHIVASPFLVFHYLPRDEIKNPARGSLRRAWMGSLAVPSKDPSGVEYLYKRQDAFSTLPESCFFNMDLSPSSLVLTVERGEPKVITPSKPTPYEYKFLSDLDSMPAHRSHPSFILVFRNSVGGAGDSVQVIKHAISEALVHYYPLAGRLLEGPNGKLIVECNARGVLFTEANANVSLDQLGFLPPPFPSRDDLIPDSCPIFNSPLLMFQVTRLLCGGFIFAIRVSHVMMDAAGCAQLLNAIGEIARGESVPSVPPVWSREQLNVRRPLPVYKESDNQSPQPPQPPPFGDMTQLSQRSFFFGPQEITTLRSHLPTDRAHSYTRWEMITACLWRCRTAALSFSPDDQVCLICAVNIRAKLNPPLPTGFYGNGSVGTSAVTTAGKLCQDPFVNTVEVVRTAKTKVTEEFVRSSIDGSVELSAPLNLARAYIVTDLSLLGVHECDLGWGKAAYWSPPWDSPIVSAFLSFTKEGENGIAVTIQLPQPAMIRFAMELAKMVADVDGSRTWHSGSTVSRPRGSTNGTAARL